MTINQGLSTIATVAILATSPATVLADATGEKSIDKDVRLASIKLAAKESAKAAAEAARAIVEDAETELDLRRITLSSSDEESVIATVAAN